MGHLSHSEHDLPMATHQAMSLAKKSPAKLVYQCGHNNSDAISEFIDSATFRNVRSDILTSENPQLLVSIYGKFFWQGDAAVQSMRLSDELVEKLSPQNRRALLFLGFSNTSAIFHERYDAIMKGTYRGDTIERVQGVLDTLHSWYEKQIAQLV